MDPNSAAMKRELHAASLQWGDRITARLRSQLAELIREHGLSVRSGDLLVIDGSWYVSHAGLLRLAARCCRQIDVIAVTEFCNPAAARWVFRAVARKRGAGMYVGYGEADPGSVSPAFRGSELRIAETRAVNRALRKALAIGLCSVDELGTLPATSPPPARAQRAPKSAQPSNALLVVATPLRDQLRRLIEDHHLDQERVRRYALQQCGARSVREICRDRFASFLKDFTERLESDRAALLADLDRADGADTTEAA